MVTAAFGAFTSVALSIKMAQREDARGVAILLYSGWSLVKTIMGND